MAKPGKQSTILKYQTHWDSRIHPAQIELAAIKRLGYWEYRGRKCGEGLPHHVGEFMRYAWPSMDRHRWTELLIEEFLNSPGRLGVFGPSSCVVGETKIEDPITGVAVEIGYLSENQIAPMVMTMNGPRRAGVPFLKGVADIYEVTMESGNKFRCTLEHRVMLPSGLYATVASLRPGDSLQGYTLSTIVDVVSGIRRVGREKFYDLNVPVEHHYFAEGCVHHNSSKSFSLSRCALTMFYARPKGTTVLISSTTLDALKRRIWDYVVSSDKEARKNLPFPIAGSLIESKLMLLADESTEDGRSFKDGIVGVACKKGGAWQGLSEYVGAKNEVMIVVADECFVSGTMIDTPSGQVPIEKIIPGDLVLNACGVGKVVATKRSLSDVIVKITTRDGRSFSCTPNHPVLTQKGWKKACEVSESHFIVDSYEAMRIVRSTSQTIEESFLRKLLRSEVVAPATGGEVQIQAKKRTPQVRAMRKAQRTAYGQILQPQLLRSLYALPSGIQGVSKGKEVGLYEGGSCEKSCMETEIIGWNEKEESDGEKGYGGKSSPKAYRDRPQACHSRRKRNRTNEVGKSSIKLFPCGPEQLSREDWKMEWERVPDMLQGGPWVRTSETCSGSGRIVSQQPGEKSAGQEEKGISGGSWVDRVEVFKQEDSHGDRSGRERNSVYNLQVDTHPSYSVSGFLVHNCQFMPMGFLDSLANLESNENCYAAMMGNLPDIHNPLGAACEPKIGWDALADTDKTRVFDTKWRNGRCVQLIGMDSPNLDFPEGQEPYRNLIGRRYIEQCAQNYGRESDKFNMFASGKIPRSSMNRTVFTKAQCVKFGAMDTVTWGHQKHTRGYCLDAAYSGIGGDRTCGAPFIFGIDNVNRWRFWLGPVKIYSGSTTSKMSHSESIAVDCKMECEAHGIEPEHVFFDGTGRSELMSAFARLWSSKVNALEFGGPATERDTFTGEKWMDGELAGQLKTCRDMFDRFVTELWFAIRHAILAEQMRGLTEDFIDENCQRKWEIVRGNKYKVEPKDGMDDGKPTGMKARGLRSPDLGDMLACGLEGARRLGFPLGKHTTPQKRTGTRWLDAMREKAWEDANKDSLEAA